MKKLLCVLLCMSLFLPQSIQAAGTDVLQQTENNESEKTVAEYFQARDRFILSDEANHLQKWVYPEVINDLIEYKSAYEQKSIGQYSLVMDLIYEAEKAEIRVYEERIDETVFHRIMLEKDSSAPYGWKVAEDNFCDNNCAFRSSGFVEENVLLATDQMNREKSGERRSEPKSFNPPAISTLISVANEEVEYHEKETNEYLYSKKLNSGDKNYTKYGLYYYQVNMAWCLAFVMWCVNQAGINNTLLPTTPAYIIQNIISNVYQPNHFHAKNSGYVPQRGDLFFTYNSTNGNYHVGIVTAVSSANFQYINGNSGNNDVRYDTKSKTDQYLLGYVHPCEVGHSNVRTYNEAYHWFVCKVCEAISLKTVHTWVAQGGKYVCSVCGATSNSPATPEGYEGQEIE